VRFPADSEVHLHLQPLAQGTMPSHQEWSLLAGDERLRASAFRRVLDRQRYVACRSWVRKVLSTYLQMPAGAIQFRYSPSGKPQLDGESARRGLSFNISHSGGWALLAVACGPRLGVDLERHRAIDDRDALVRRFSPAEQRAYYSLPPEERFVAFFSAWSRKEAFIKACGDGFAIPLADFDVSLRPGEAASLLAIRQDREAARGWTLAAPELMPEYSAAVAIEVSQATLVMHCDGSAAVSQHVVLGGSGSRG
jgi:4'-phosphopantetheinyl transferase